MVRRALLQGLPWVLAAGALVSALNGFLGQAALQAELSKTMSGVLTQVRTARLLTAETAAALAPLADTSRTLAVMNDRLRGVESDLRTMNGGMERLLQTQDSLLQGLRRVNGRTEAVISALDESEQLNRRLLNETSALAEQTGGQAASAERLRTLTGGARSALQELNRRFSFLKR